MDIGGFNHLTLLDFPGLTACTVFTAGCNLRCPFCHNFQLVSSEAADGNAEEEFFRFLKKRRGILDGVCISGGEPLLNSDISEFMQKIRSLGYKLKLDTNGTLPERLRDVISKGLIDYVAMDIKSSPGGYQKASGTGHIALDKIRESINILESSGIPHEFRTTVVKGIHQKYDIEEAAAMLPVSSLYYLQSFKPSENVPDSMLGAFSKDTMQEFLDAARQFVPKATLRGID